jgi:hypothetical protein
MKCFFRIISFVFNKILAQCYEAMDESEVSIKKEEENIPGAVYGLHWP